MYFHHSAISSAPDGVIGCHLVTVEFEKQKPLLNDIRINCNIFVNTKKIYYTNTICI